MFRDLETTICKQKLCFNIDIMNSTNTIYARSLKCEHGTMFETRSIVGLFLVILLNFSEKNLGKNGKIYKIK